MAHIIVVGNEKGGSGKSTLSMHIATALARMGHAVGALDLDMRQRSFARYLKNRDAYAAAQRLDLPSPRYEPMPEGAAQGPALDAALGDAIETLEASCAFVVVDCPGSHTRLSQFVHSMADTLVTPLNDSFVDFDVLARIDGPTGEIQGPSIYAEMVWAARQMRARAEMEPIDWVVVRNRVGQLYMHNKAKMERALEELSSRIGFRIVPGFSERVIFRELFPRGLTLLDLRDVGVEKLSISNVAARQELRELIGQLELPGVKVSF